MFMLFCQYLTCPFRQPACGAQCRRLSFPAASLPCPRFDRKVAYKALIRSHFLVKGEPRKNFSLSFPARQGTGGATQTLPAASLRPANRLPANRVLRGASNYLIYTVLWSVW